jgi:hypothetical protein
LTSSLKYAEWNNKKKETMGEQRIKKRKEKEMKGKRKRKGRNIQRVLTRREEGRKESRNVILLNNSVL